LLIIPKIFTFYIIYSKDKDLHTTLYQTDCAGEEMMEAARIASGKS